MGITQLSDDYGIKIPLEIWAEIGLKPGDLVELRIEDGSLIIAPSSTSYADYLRRLNSQIWDGVHPDEYVRQERDAWERDANA
jgi:bifunctional DNA-binding transcriptional regulator/antitoxin component of YhaV-PrlF toxin-antitoxin module